MIPIDDLARNGKHHLLQASDGTLHSARWDGESWVYSNGSPVQKFLTHYSTRLAHAGRQQKAH